MATKSILKTIHIKEKGPATALVGALVSAKGKSEKDVPMKRTCSEASKSEIRKMFIGSHDGV